ncbi:MAG: flagellar hook-length control protein FliK [Lachnospiraceae bacterium]|nr:flagellar hook-length control protein FliK [Lachnospiraceae bacterium]
MVTTAVKSTAVDFPYAVPDAASASKDKSVGQDFMKILTQEREKTQKTEVMQDKADTGAKTEDVQEPDCDNDVQDEYENKEVKAEEEADTVVEERTTEEATTTQETSKEQTEEGPAEETMEAVEEALRKIIEEMQAKLQMSEEEILGAAENLGLSVVDLLNPENMAQLVLTLGGQDSAIHLVTDEAMYMDVQELTAFVEEQAQLLMEETGLSQEEMDSLMTQLKQLEEAVMVETDGISEEVLNVEDADELNITVKGENVQKAEAAPETTQNVDEIQNTKQERPADEGTAKDGESNFQNQQGNLPEYQNKVDNVQAPSTTVADFMKEGTLDVENLLRQLTDHVKIQHSENMTEMELQLHPASLGTINVTLTTKGGVVTAELTTQNENVKSAIEAQVVQLRANLEEQGVKVEAIEVSVASHEMERNLDQSNQEQRGSEDSQRTEGIQGIRRRSINLNSLEEGDGLEDGALLEDDATKLAVEMMTMHGNSMDLMV